jgi:hypothetical protein
MGHLVLLDRLQDARHVEHVALLEVELVADVANKAVVAVAGEDDGAVAFLDELAAGFGADHAHAAGNQHFHARFPPLSSAAPDGGWSAAWRKAGPPRN